MTVGALAEAAHTLGAEVKLQAQAPSWTPARSRNVVNSGPWAPEGDWYKDFGSFMICGSGEFPKTVRRLSLQRA